MFTGHQWDGESGLYYAPERYYSPFQARWTTRDPLGMVDGPNVYAYVRGNPVRFHDSLGLLRTHAAPWSGGSGGGGCGAKGSGVFPPLGESPGLFLEEIPDIVQPLIDFLDEHQGRIATCQRGYINCEAIEESTAAACAACFGLCMATGHFPDDCARTLKEMLCHIPSSWVNRIGILTPPIPLMVDPHLDDSHSSCYPGFA